MHMNVAVLFHSFWREPASVLQMLEPMFEMDFYLPRCFMAVLKFEKLDVVSTEAIPPEVTLAGLYFYFKSLYFDYESNKKVWRDYKQNWLN